MESRKRQATMDQMETQTTSDSIVEPLSSSSTSSSSTSAAAAAAGPTTVPGVIEMSDSLAVRRLAQVLYECRGIISEECALKLFEVAFFLADEADERMLNALLVEAANEPVATEMKFEELS